MDEKQLQGFVTQKKIGGEKVNMYNQKGGVNIKMMYVVDGAHF